MTDGFAAFYVKRKPDLSVISHLGFRHFRLSLPNGRFLKVKDRIRNDQTLQKHLLKHNPLDVYYSVSWWLNPTEIGLKKENRDILLGSDIVFDIDVSSKLYSLEAAREETLKLLDFLAERGLCIGYIAFSGAKGFHVLCKDEENYNDCHYSEREGIAERKRRMFVNEVENAGIVIDKKVTVDTRRIIRVPGTINPKTGYACTVLKRCELERPLCEILKSIPRIDITASVTQKADDGPTSLGKISGGQDRPEVRSPPYHFSSFLTSYAFSDRHIAILQFPKQLMGSLERRLRKLQDNYRMGDLHLFESDHFILALSLCTFQRRRLEKILRNSRSLNLNAFLKYGNTYFRIGKSVDEDMELVEKPPKFIKTLISERSVYVSRGHLEFFKGVIPLRDYQKVHGRENVDIVHTIISNEKA